jgi:hypothetical protein
MNFDTRIAVVVRNDLMAWQKLNVAAFTISGIATLPAVTGAPYVDASGRAYLPMIKQPIAVFLATSSELRAAFERTFGLELALAIFTEELFATPDDDANRAAVRGVKTEQLNLAGLAMRGRKKLVDMVVKGIRLHP